MARNTQAPISNQVNSFDEELAKFAKQFGAQEQVTGGNFFSFGVGSISYDGASFPNGEMACIILDGMFENVFYEGPYDPSNPRPPVCFAYSFADRGEGMTPHELSSKRQCDNCKACPKNQWGSGKKADGTPSKGKACKNTRRLAIIPAGSFVGGQFQAIAEKEHFRESAMGYARLPVTSVENYQGYVKQVADALSRPPFGVFTKIKSVPDPKNQFKVVFEVLGKVPNSILQIIMERYKSAHEEITFPYQPMNEEEIKPVAGKAPVKKKKY